MRVLAKRGAARLRFDAAVLTPDASVSHVAVISPRDAPVVTAAGLGHASALFQARVARIHVVAGVDPRDLHQVCRQQLESDAAAARAEKTGEAQRQHTQHKDPAGMGGARPGRETAHSIIVSQSTQASP
jgi:hypothetical protein